MQNTKKTLIIQKRLFYLIFIFTLKRIYTFREFLHKRKFKYAKFYICYNNLVFFIKKF